MKSGARQLLADFLKEFTGVNKAFVEADFHALQKKYSELFTLESAVATANWLVMQRNFMDLQDVSVSAEKIIKLKNAVTFVQFVLETNKVETDPEARWIVQFNIYNASLKLQHDMLMVLAEPNKYIEHGRYRQTISDLKQVDRLLTSLNWVMLGYIENPTKPSAFKSTKFYENFRMGISNCILNGILNHSKFGLLLNLLEQHGKATKVAATCREQLRKIDDNLKSFCRKTSAKYGPLKKNLEESNKEIQGVLSSIAYPVFPTSTSVMLEQLEDILENDKRAYPILSFKEWAELLEDGFTRLQTAFAEEAQGDQVLEKEMLELLPSANISITNPQQAISLFTHAKKICIEFVKREKLKKVANGMQSIIQTNLAVEYLEILIKQYIVKINELLNLKNELKVYDLIVDISESPIDLENQEAMQVVLAKHTDQYFSNIATTRQTIELLLNMVETDRRFCAGAYFQILFFVKKMIPADILKGNQRFLAFFQEKLLSRSSQLLALWQQCQVLEGYYHQLKESIYINMEICAECENWLTENGYSYDQIRFFNISIEHAEFLLQLGHWGGFCQQIQIIETRLTRCQPDKKAIEKLAQLKQQAPARLSRDGLLYQCLVEFQIKLEKIKIEVVCDKLVKSITDQVPFTTPLMILEDIIDEREFTVAAAESLIIAFEYVNEEAFRYERRLFFAQLCRLFAEYRRVLIQNTNGGTKQLVAEKITYLLNIASVICEIEPEVTGSTDDVKHASVKLIERIADTQWEQLGSEIPSIIQQFQGTLFLNRKTMVKALVQMPHFMHPKTNFVTDIKVLHVLLVTLDKFKPAFGRMDAIKEQLILSLYRVLCNHLIVTSVAIHEKKIDNYVDAVTEIENYMALLERYMPIFQKFHPCFTIEPTDHNFQNFWQNLKSLCDVYMMYAVANVMQVQIKKAQQAVKKAEFYLEHLKATVKTQQQAEFVNQLEQYGSRLKLYWSNHKAREIALPGRALQQFILCEKQTSSILAKISSAEFGRRDKVEELASPDPARPFAGFVRLVDTFMEIPGCSMIATKPQLAVVIRQFQSYQNIFAKFTNPETDSLCVVEILSQKLNKIIPLLEAALRNLPDVEEVPSVARLGMMLSEVCIEDDNDTVVAITQPRAVKLEPKPSLLQFNREVQLLRLPPSITEDDPKIQDLLAEAAAITADLDGLEHYYLYESYKEFFATTSSVLALAKAAIKNTHRSPGDQKQLKLQNVSLMHFILLYFSQQLSLNQKIKFICLEILWENLTTLLNDGVDECVYGKIAIGQCQQALEHYRRQRSLYEYYLLQAEIASDDERFLRLDRQQFQAIENQEQSTAAIRAILYTFKAKLEQFITEMDNGCVLNVMHGKHSFSKKLRGLNEFSKQNLEKVIQLFEVIKEPSARNESIHFLKELSSLFLLWVKRNKKSQIENLGERLLTESLQTIVDYISQAIPQIKLKANRVLQSAEKRVVADLEKMEIEDDAKPVCLSGNFNQILAVFRSCPHVKECYLVGGAIRDLLLNLTPNDYDFYVKCDPVLFVSHFVDAYQPAPHKRPELYRLRHLEQQGVRHDIVCTLGECPYEADLTINSFLWDGTTLHDPWECLNDLRAPVLLRRGDSATEFKNDPTKILRTIRLSNHTLKGISSDEMVALIAQAWQVTSMEVGLYLANLTPLFLRTLEQAHLNLNFLIHHNILNCLLPPPLCEDVTFVHCVKNGTYLHNSLFQLYIRHMTPHGTLFNEDTKYELLAIFLLPMLLGRQPNMENKLDKISEVVEEYCQAYQGFAKDNGGSFKLRFKVKSFLSNALKLYPLPMAPNSQLKY